ncbi:MAG: hypothetical protein ACKO96_04880 [Flammeovirgaceae bacterium]
MSKFINIEISEMIREDLSLDFDCFRSIDLDKLSNKIISKIEDHIYKALMSDDVVEIIRNTIHDVCQDCENNNPNMQSWQGVLTANDKAKAALAAAVAKIKGEV